MMEKLNVREEERRSVWEGKERIWIMKGGRRKKEMERGGGRVGGRGEGTKLLLYETGDEKERERKKRKREREREREKED